MARLSHPDEARDQRIQLDGHLRRFLVGRTQRVEPVAPVGHAARHCVGDRRWMHLEQRD